MFELKEATVEVFINDEKIMLPRFQRKQTWIDKKNFELCISLYKDFPLGVVVINVEEEDGKFQKWLLDGRQRRNALLKMQDPEEIYRWAKAFIGFKTNDTTQELVSKFWDKIDEFLDDENEENNTDNKNSVAIEENEEVENNEKTPTEDLLFDTEEHSVHNQEVLTETETNQAQISISFKRGDIQRLLDVILMVHPIRGNQSGLTKPFNFSKYVGGLDYIINDENNNEIVSTQDLLSWIEYRKEYYQRKGQQYPPTEEEFFEWLTRKNTRNYIKTEQVIRREIKRRWEQIHKTLVGLESLKLQIKEGRIGYIQLKNCNDNDAKKIFELINTAGTPLETAEILSAKPSWNVVVDNPSDKVKNNVKQLYLRLGVPQPESLVKWDVAATLLDRLNLDFIITPQENDITFGFKLLSAYYLGGISKDEIAKLPKHPGVNWAQLDFEKKLNILKDELLKSYTFRYWASWNKSILSATSQAIVINFLIITLKDWERKGRPTNNNSTEHKQFIKNSLITLDKLIYQYVTNQWRGSTDSKTKSTLQALEISGDVFDPIKNENWKNLMEEAVQQGKLNGNDYSNSQSIDKRIKLLLIYYYTLNEISGPDLKIIKEYDFDHIISKSEINASSSKYAKDNISNIFNICTLPKKDNITKGDRVLSNISETWLKQQIETYAEIPSIKFSDFSLPSAMNDLFKFRGAKLVDSFLTKRKEIIG